jgi:two-component system nitrate/nitrite response regulator NarP
MTKAAKSVLMIVEDDQFVRGWLSHHCDHLFDEVHSFALAEKAMSSASAMGDGLNRVWLVDLNLKEGSQGCDLTSSVKSSYPGDRVIVLSMTEDHATIWMTLNRAGADVFLLKGFGDAFAMEVQRAVDAARDGQRYTSEIMRRMPADNPSLIATLTDRQLEILKYAASGMGNSEIATILGVNPSAITRTRESTEKKTRKPWEYLVEAIHREGWLTPEPPPPSGQ